MDPDLAFSCEDAHLTEAASGGSGAGSRRTWRGSRHLPGDLATLGVLFESAVIHDLTVLASAMDGDVRHYRDSNAKEIDAIITLPDGRWGAVEVKLSGMQLPYAATSLNDVIAQIDTDLVGEPAFRLVVTGTGPVLVTDDGTVTTPLTALAP